jgi:hypothetical protein
LYSIVSIIFPTVIYYLRTNLLEKAQTANGGSSRPLKSAIGGFTETIGKTLWPEVKDQYGPEIYGPTPTKKPAPGIPGRVNPAQPDWRKAHQKWIAGAEVLFSKTLTRQSFMDGFIGFSQVYRVVCIAIV